MTNYSLISIGVPEIYRNANPFQFTTEQLLDAFPEQGNPEALDCWMGIKRNGFESPSISWQRFLSLYEAMAKTLNLNAFVLAFDRRNSDEALRNFLAPRRRRVRAYLDRLGLVMLPIRSTNIRYTRKSNSFWLRPQARIIAHIDSALPDILKRDQHWIKTHCPEYTAAVSYHKWIDPGVLRVGISLLRTESWLWYEIRSPLNPGQTAEFDEAGFERHVNSIWLPLVKNQRWLTTSNPRLWNF